MASSQKHILLLMVFCIAVGPAVACTIFMATEGEITLVGNNEDWKDPETKVWFLVPEEDKHGRVYFGFSNGWAQGGMNDQGLFFDWVAGYKGQWSHDPEKKDYLGGLGELILEKAATVEEAIEFYGQYNEPAFDKAKIMFVDRMGVSAVVGFEKGKLKVDLANGTSQTLGYGEKIAATMLRKPGAVTLDSFFKILKASLQKGFYSTKYSNLYDLSNGEVHVCDFRNGKEVVTFNLQKELAKESHYFDIPELEHQLDKPPGVDGKTLAPVAVDPALIADYVGVYKINATDSFSVTVDGGRLFGQVTLGETQGAKREYRAASETKFFLPYYDQQVTFFRDDNGKVAKILLQSFDGEDFAVKID